MKVPLFVELCAGLASVSGVLQHGSTWKPPVSRMGRKTGYSGAILRVMGLRPRQKAERYLWAEADGDVAALLAAYTQPEVMREIAAIIRSWIPCPYGPHAPDPSCPRCKGTGRWDARDLWEVLRREKRRGLWGGGGEAGDVAAGITLAQWSWKSEPRHGWYGPGATEGGTWGREKRDAALERERQGHSLDAAALPWPPVLIAQDAAVDVGSVAGWVVSGAWSAGGAVDGYWAGPDRGGACGSHPPGWTGSVTLPGLVSRFSCSVWPPVTLTPDAAIQPAHIPPGTVVYMDPPYAGTTGYKHALDRAAVIEIAQRWHDAGARVYISEAEPVEIEGWHHVEISGERRGQARTFSAQQAEWLTCSHPPAWTPPRQGGFGW